MATELYAKFGNDLALALTPVGGGRFEVYLNDRKIWDRKEAPGRRYRVRRKATRPVAPSAKAPSRMPSSATPGVPLPVPARPPVPVFGNAGRATGRGAWAPGAAGFAACAAGALGRWAVAAGGGV